jgi:hypothetical protein
LLLLLLLGGGLTSGSSSLDSSSLGDGLGRRNTLHTLDHKSKGALAAVVAIVVLGHEGAYADVTRTLLKNTRDRAIRLNLVALEDAELVLDVLVLVLLRLGVDLLLALLGTTIQSESNVNSSLVKDAISSEGEIVREGKTTEEKSDLLRRDARIDSHLTTEGGNRVKFNGSSRPARVTHEELHFLASGFSSIEK